MSLKDRIFGVGNRIFTILGLIAGFLVGLAQYLDLVPESWRSSKWYVVAAGLIAVGAWWKKNFGEDPAKLGPSSPPTAG